MYLGQPCYWLNTPKSDGWLGMGICFRTYFIKYTIWLTSPLIEFWVYTLACLIFFLVRIPSVRLRSKPQMPCSILCPQMNYWPLPFTAELCMSWRFHRLWLQTAPLATKWPIQATKASPLCSLENFRLKTLIQAVKEAVWRTPLALCQSFPLPSDHSFSKGNIRALTMAAASWDKMKQWMAQRVINKPLFEQFGLLLRCGFMRKKKTNNLLCCIFKLNAKSHFTNRNDCLACRIP